MVDTDGQDDTAIENIDNNEYYDSDEEDDYTLDNKVYQRLQQNDPTITTVNVMLNSVKLNGSQQYYFNSIDWENNGDCISDNTHLNKLMISYHGSCLGRPHDQPYIFGEDGNNLPTRQQLQHFFSSIYRNSSIKELEFHRDDLCGAIFDFIKWKE